MIMTQEEKAKAYDEAIKRAKEINNEQKAQPFDVMLKVFPELKENEDDRIKNALIFHYQGDGCICTNEYRIDYKDICAWLEKQGEPKNIDSDDLATLETWEDVIKENKEKWQLSDWFVEATALLIKKVKRIENNENINIKGSKVMLNACVNVLRNVGHSHLSDWLEKQGEEKSITNVPSREIILAIWDLGNEWKELTKGSISTEYGTQLDYIQKHWQESEYYLRAKQSEQKSAKLSEEDEENFRDIIGAIHGVAYQTTEDEEARINWLKTLKQRMCWKPSDEQIKSLKVVKDYVISNNWNDYICNSLESLLEQLKILKERF